MKICEVVSDTPSIVDQIINACVKCGSVGTLRQIIDTGVGTTHSTARGFNWDGMIGIKDVRERKEPSDTPLVYHYAYNELLVQKFGHPYRTKSLFTYCLDLNDIFSYESSPESFIVIPDDGTKYLYSTEDSNGDLYLRLRFAEGRLITEFNSKAIGNYQRNKITLFNRDRRKYSIDSILDYIRSVGGDEDAEMYSSVVYDNMINTCKEDIDKLKETDNIFADSERDDNQEAMINAKSFVFINVAELNHYLYDEGMPVDYFFMVLGERLDDKGL